MSSNQIEVDSQEPASALHSLAQIVRSRRMEVPAIFMLEMYKPLTTVFHATALISQPLLVPLFGTKFAAKAVRLLESRDQVEQLIQLLEKPEGNNQ